MKEACNQQNLNMPQIEELYIHAMGVDPEWAHVGGGGAQPEYRPAYATKGWGGGTCPTFEGRWGHRPGADPEGPGGGGAAPLDPRLAYNL